MEEAKLHMRIPRDLREALEAEAKADDRSLNSLIVHTLRSSIKGRRVSRPDALTEIGEKAVR